jgi:hypothetical protein
MKKTAAVFSVMVIAAFFLSGCKENDSKSGEVPAADVILEFDASGAGHEIADTMWGIFYEDINYAADGGLYPELVRNRSFEDRAVAYNPVSRHTQYWTHNYNNMGTGAVTGETASPLNEANPNYVTVDVAAAPYILANRGYGTSASPAMSVTSGAVYNFYFYAKVATYTGNIVCNLEDVSGTPVANTVTVSPDSAAWKKYGPYVFTVTTSENALLSLRFTGTGRIDLDFVSVMPTNTWGYGEVKWPHGGLRKDLVQALKDMNPGFIRFPGGCIVEGSYRHNTHYNWKDTIGDPEERKENYNLWGYMMSYGLGFHEFFQLCEDLDAEPVPVLYAGIVCQARRDNVSFEPDLAPGEPAMEQLVQDYLDLIEYANGAASTVWGAKRAANGHPNPFSLKKIGIGNENWEANYWRNFAYIREKVLQAYPDIKIITSTGPLSSGWINDMAWAEINVKYTDSIVDEHYYEAPAWFLNNTRRYDRYNRNGVLIFAGEYAAHETNRNNTWYSALCEATYMTALERNADLVKMASYAPLFARLGMTQWRPDMIWFDGEKITSLTPNYHVQKLFMNNTGKNVLPAAEEPGPAWLFQSTSVNGNKIYTKLVNPRDGEKVVRVKYANVNISSARLVKLSAASQSATTVTIKEETAAVNGSNEITLTLAPYSMVLIHING